MYSFRLNKQMQKFLEKQNKDFLKIFMLKLNILINNPFENNLDIKPLKGLNNHFRLRIGKYRFLYSIIEEEVYIYFYKGGSRGDIYKK